MLRGANPPAKPDRSSVKGLSLVTVANVTQKTVPLQLQVIGSVLPASTVAISISIESQALDNRELDPVTLD